MRILWRGLELPETQSEVLNTVIRNRGVPFLQLASLVPKSNSDIAAAVSALEDRGLVSVRNKGDELLKTVTANFDALAGLETIEK